MDVEYVLVDPVLLGFLRLLALELAAEEGHDPGQEGAPAPASAEARAQADGEGRRIVTATGLRRSSHGEAHAVDLLAWGTHVRVAVTSSAALPAAEAYTRSWLDVVDRACSRFRDDSDLMAVNQAPDRAVPVSDVLIEALTAACDAARVTDGLVTPTVGAAVRAAGYDRTFTALATSGPSGLLPSGLAPLPTGPAPDWRSVTVDRQAGTVEVPAGCHLDLGSTTKAWAADRLAERLVDALSCGVLVDLGGDLVAAGPAPTEGWLIQVVDGDPSADVGPLVVIHDGALATSSTVVRRWVRDGAQRHHIIDPRTGLSSDDLWRTVTVQAATCFDANVVSTATVVLGDAAPAWLEQVGLPARLVRRDGAVLAVNGWPADDVQTQEVA